VRDRREFCKDYDGIYDGYGPCWTCQDIPDRCAYYEPWTDGAGNFYSEDETMVDLGGGMLVPLRELMEDDD
jgi:hypothetical protein